MKRPKKCRYGRDGYFGLCNCDDCMKNVASIMTPPEQSADKLADRLAEAAEAATRFIDFINYGLKTGAIRSQPILDRRDATAKQWPIRTLGFEADELLTTVEQALAAYREAKSAAPKEAITDTQRLERIADDFINVGRVGDSTYFLGDDSASLCSPVKFDAIITTADFMQAFRAAIDAAMLQNRATCG